MSKNIKMVKGNWYIYNRGKGDFDCNDCKSKTDIPFICKGNEEEPPFHPNCLCSVESYQDKMIQRIKGNYASISNAQLDELLQREYYRYNDIASPTYIIGDYYYYVVENKAYKVNITTLRGVGRLPDGRYVIGAANEKENVLLYERIKANTLLKGDTIVDIVSPAYSGESFASVDGEKKSITYFGQEYHGRVRNGELYLDIESQQRFLKQVELTAIDPFGEKWKKYRTLSVSEIINVHPYQGGNKPYDPSKPLPTLSEEEKAAIGRSGVAGGKGITDNILLTRKTIENGNVTALRFASSLSPGVVTITDYYIASKTKAEWENEEFRVHNMLGSVADSVETIGQIGNIDIPTSWGILHIPFEQLGWAGSLTNFAYSIVQPKSTKYLGEELKDVGKWDQITLPFYIVGYEAQFDEHGNLTLTYAHKYRFSQKQF